MTYSGEIVKWHARTEFYSNSKTRIEFWWSSGVRMQDVAATVGFNSKLELDCNIRKAQGARCKILGIYQELDLFLY
jgi:hypothetical protein